MRIGIYLALFADPEGQISWIKIKKSDITFCKLKTSLRRNVIYNLQTFRGFCRLHFYVFVANSA